MDFSLTNTYINGLVSNVDIYVFLVTLRVSNLNLVFYNTPLMALNKDKNVAEHVMEVTEKSSYQM